MEYRMAGGRAIIDQFRKRYLQVEYAWTVFRALLLFGMAFIILYPFLVKLAGSFMSIEDLFDSTVHWVARRPTLDHYQAVFVHMRYPSAAINSLMLALSVSGLQVISTMMIGYGLARFRFPGRNLLFGCFLFTLLVPPELLLIPLYLNFRFFRVFGLFGADGVNLLNSVWPLLLMAATGSGIRTALFIYIMRQFFRGVPRSLEEAAFVDGAGPFATFFRVMVPIAGAPILVTFLLSFVWQWNDYFYTTMIYQRESPFLVHAFLGVAQNYRDALREAYGYILPPNVFPPEISTLITNTASIFYTAPLLLLYVVLQRYFIESVERTGIVG